MIRGRASRLVVVGNAEPTKDLSEQIDRCDRVIRFNLTPFFDTRKTGRKTTILSLFGLSYPRGGEIQEKLNPSVVESCETIWVETTALFEPLERGHPGISRQKLKLLALHCVHDNYSTPGAKRIERPSSGFQVLRYLVNSPAFAAFEKFICGFEFRGGPCHPWQQEKRQVARYLELGLLRSILAHGS